MYFNNKQLELPTKTLALTEKIQEINKQTDSIEAYKKMMEFLVFGLGEEKTEEILGTTDINEVDCVLMNRLCNLITMSYEQEVAKDQLDYAKKILNDKLFKDIASLGNVMNAKK